MLNTVVIMPFYAHQYTYAYMQNTKYFAKIKTHMQCTRFMQYPWCLYSIIYILLVVSDSNLDRTSIIKKINKEYIFLYIHNVTSQLDLIKHLVRVAEKHRVKWDKKEKAALFALSFSIYERETLGKSVFISNSVRKWV